MDILALSGSLRNGSYNTALLQAAVKLAPADMNITLFESLASLPHFHPQIAENQLPDSVVHYRCALQQADGVIISTPEYAYGMPGVLKNALDWVVSSGELVLKPVASLSASTSELGGVRAHSALVVILNAMNARVIIDASVNVPFVKAKFSDNGELLDPTIKQALAASLSALQHAVEEAP